MKNMSRDLFDPRTVMDSEYERSSPKEGNFGFAFNDSNFSDRVLRIEIMAGPSHSKSHADGCCSLFDWARNRKCRREDLKKNLLIDNTCNLGLEVIVCPEEQVLNQSDGDDVLACENDDEEAIAMIEEIPSGTLTRSSFAQLFCPKVH